MNRDQFISLFFLALLLFVVYQIVAILSPFMTAFFWSAILAFGFYPVHIRVRTWLGDRETVSALVMTFIIFLIVIPPLTLLGVNITGQAIELYQAVSDYVRHGQLEKAIDDLRALPLIQSIETNLFRWDIAKEQASTWLINSSKALGNYTAAQVGTITKNLLFVILNTLIMLFLVFIFLKDGRKIYTFIYEIAPLAKKNRDSIFEQITGTLGAVIRGQLLTSLVQGVISGIIFWGLSLPVPIIFGALTFAVSMIPVLGAAGVWFPLVVYLFIQESYVKAGILFACGFFIISLVDNVLKPALIGEKTKLPFFLLFFGMLGGLKLYGLMGIFLAPVMLSLFFSLIRIYQEEYLSKDN